MTLLISSLTIGLILSLLAFGVFITFRLFRFPDITAEGSITFGASIAAILIVSGMPPILATAAAFLGGMLAGITTGMIHTRFKINGLLSGILVTTALYSINLHVMGRSNIPLMFETTLVTQTENIGRKIIDNTDSLVLLGWNVAIKDLTNLILFFLLICIIGFLIYLFFRTDLGTSMRASGDNADMIRALGVNEGNMIIIGLALSNGLIALAGALLAQYQGFADVQMGIGMLVWGLASVIIGEALVGSIQLGYKLIGAVMGSLLFRLLVAVALRWGLNPNDLKLITALFVFIALILPDLLRKIDWKKERALHA